MSLFDFLILLAIAGLCGAAGQAVTGFSRGGCLASVGVGFVGALIGTWLSRELGLGEILAVTVGGTSFPVVWSILGGALFVAVIGLVTRRRV